MRNLPSWSQTGLSALLIAATSSLLGSSAVAAPPADRAATLNEDIRFAQDLARFRLFDLAVEWLASIEKEGGLDADNKVEVSLAKAKVSELAALNALTRDARKRYYDDSVEHYKIAVASMKGPLDLRRVEATAEGLARVQIDKGIFWVEEMNLLRTQTAPQAQLDEARTKAEEAFRESETTLNSVYADVTEFLEDVPEDVDEADVARMRGMSLYSVYRKGEAFFHRAGLYQAQDFNREDYLRKCLESLTDYLWEAGEDEFVLTCLAYYYQGMAQWELGKINADQAAKFDAQAIAQLTPIHGEFGLQPKLMVDLSDSEKAYVLGVLEKGIRGESQIYRNAAARIEATTTIADTEDLSSVAFDYGVVKSGKNEKPWQIEKPVFKESLVAALRNAAVGLVTELEKEVSSVGMKLTQEGERARLEKAKALIDLGRASEALQIVTNVAENNERTMVGLEANSMLGEVIEQTGGASAPPSVWWLACEGHYTEDRWIEALDAAHMALLASTSDADKTEFTAMAWARIGDCYQRMDRNLEAALALDHGLLAAKAINDEDGRNDLALSAYTAWNRRFSETKDSFDEKYRNKARDVVTSLGISGDVQYFVAREAFTNASALTEAAARKAAFIKAVDEFRAVPESSAYFEPAMVNIGRCYAEAAQSDKGKVDQAMMAKALEAWDAIAARAADPSKAVGLNKKKAQQRGIALAQATFYKAQLLQDNERWADVMTTLAGYETNHDTQTNFFAPVNYYRIKALVGLGKVDEAEAVLGKLQANFAKSQYAMYGTNVVANGHFAAYEAIPADQRAEDPEATRHLRSAAEYLDAYNKARGYDSFTNLQLVADWFRILEEWQISAEHYKRLIAKFGKDPARQRAVNAEVMPAYGEVLLALKSFTDALPVWRDVYASQPNNRDVVVNLARCLGGWLVEEEDRFGRVTYSEIGGAGNHKEAFELLVKLRQRVEKAENKYDAIWWDLNVLALYNVVQWSKDDPTVKVSGQKLIKNWTQLMPDLGGDPWARRLRYLENQLR